ncbi:MAG: organic solvent tolerance protein OstA [Treponema sp.]|nr:organic solvent tolerance protein OstA [Treponema sp.]
MKKNFLPVFVILFFSIPLWAEKIVFSANAMTGQAGNSNTTTTLSGNAYVKTESMEIQADSLELSGDDYRFIKAEGNISGKNLKTNMTFSCDSLSYDRSTKLAQLKGNVDFQDVENEVRAQAQIIIYDEVKETSIMQIKINLTQKDNVCSGSYAVYYKTEQLLEISGNAQVKQKDDVFRAQHITLDMDTQEITLGGNVKGSVSDSKPVKKSESGEAEETSGESDGSELSEAGESAEGEDDKEGESEETGKETESSEENTTEVKDGE